MVQNRTPGKYYSSFDGHRGYSQYNLAKMLSQGYTKPMRTTVRTLLLDLTLGLTSPWAFV
jgi:hypothetical protein